MSYKCKNCGADISSKDMFCPQCGTKNDFFQSTPQFESAAKIGEDNTANPSLYQEQFNSAPNQQGNFDAFGAPIATPKKSKFPIIPIIIGAAALFLGIFVFVLSLLIFPLIFGSNPLTDFKANEVYLVSDTPYTLTFTVNASNSPRKVDLYDDTDTFLGEMNDEGLYGDEVAGDGVYTTIVDVYTDYCEEPVTKDYYCKTKGKKATLSTYVFPLPTEESMQIAHATYNDVTQNIESIESGYANQEGYVPEESYDALIEDVTGLLDEYVESGDVFHYEVEDASVYIKFSSGLGSLYTPATPGTDAVGSDTRMSIYTFQPCFTEMGGENYAVSYDLPHDLEYALQLMDCAGDDIDDEFGNYSFPSSHDYNDTECTLDAIKEFGANQVILWHGHGCYGPVIKSCLLTGDPFDWNAWLYDPEYYQDCISNRIINNTWIEHEYAVISPGYFEKYCGSMENSFIYLAACQSGKSADLANAFVRKGATVVANTETIMRSYNIAMLHETVSGMLQVDPSTSTYYTLSDALANAKEKYGDDDTAYGGSHRATPVIFGGEEAENYRFAPEVPTGILSGKICRASDRITPVGNATVSIYLEDTLYATTTSDSTGHYSIELPRGPYTVDITASGFMDFTAYALVSPDLTTYMETFLMIVGDESYNGYATGTVVNSLAGASVADVHLSAVKGWNNTDENAPVIGTAITNSQGEYTINLPYGNYTLVATKENYTTSYFNIIIQEGTTSDQNGTITPEIIGDNYLITLTWGSSPSDLDSHVVGWLSNGSRFHVYYNDKNQTENGVQLCNLDYDDTSSYGPEHITLNATCETPYYYYIHKYSNSGSLPASGAQITIEQSNVLIARFNVPTNLASKDYWNVFAIKDGELIINNTITSSPDITYAND